MDANRSTNPSPVPASLTRHPRGAVRLPIVLAALVLALAGCRNTSTDPALYDFDSLVLTPMSGEVLTGKVGQATEQPVRLRLTDETGRPVPGVPVSFRLLSDGGMVSPEVARSDSRGIVETQWVLGEAAGNHQLAIEGNDSRLWRFFRGFFLRAQAAPDEPSSVEVSPGGVVLEVGEDETFHAVVHDQYGNEIVDPSVRWSTDQPALAEIDAGGRALALAAGQLRVIATAEKSSGEAVEGTAAVEVSEPVGEEAGPVVTVRITPDAVFLSGVDATEQLEALVESMSLVGPATVAASAPSGDSLEWTSLSEDVVTVSGDGIVRSRAPGRADVVARLGPASDTISVEVSVEEPDPDHEEEPADGGEEPDPIAAFDASGSWSITASVLGQTQNSTLVMVQDGEDVSGDVVTPAGERHELTGTMTDRRFEGSFHTDTYGTAHLSLDFAEAEVLDGTIQVLGDEGPVTGHLLKQNDGDEGGDGEGGSMDPAEDPVGEPGTGAGNEPEGVYVLTSRDFSGEVEDGWNNWEMAGSFDVVSGAGELFGSSVGRMTFPVGMGSTRPAVSARGGFDARELYVRFRIKVSENWNGHPSNVNKVFYITDSSTGGNGSPIYVALWGGGSGSLRVDVHRQNPDLSPSQVFYSPNVGTREIRRGQWHDVELILRMNSSGGSHDGEIHVWVDGLKTTQHTGLRFAPSGDFAFDAISWEPYWGGQNATLDRTQYMYLDRVYLSGR